MEPLHLIGFFIFLWILSLFVPRGDRFRYINKAGAWRAYFLGAPSSREHILTDSDGVYICWDTPLRTREDARKVAQLWVNHYGRKRSSGGFVRWSVLVLAAGLFFLGSSPRAVVEGIHEELANSAGVLRPVLDSIKNSYDKRVLQKLMERATSMIPADTGTVILSGLKSLGDTVLSLPFIQKQIKEHQLEITAENVKNYINQGASTPKSSMVKPPKRIVAGHLKKKYLSNNNALTQN